MDDEKLTSRLKSVGMGFFVEYFDELYDNTIVSHNIILKLERENKFTSSARASRVSSARSILKQGMGELALRKVVLSTSRRVSDKTRDLARYLLMHYFKSSV
ncbi:TPA: hypothetical protein ACJHGT_003643 [Yersinia enterocolitica]